MSRTKRGNKGPGYDYWKARPFAGDSPTRRHHVTVKHLTHRVERRERKLVARAALDGVERDSRWPRFA